MPGYKGHLVGGVLTYGFVLAVVLTLQPLIMYYALQTPHSFILYSYYYFLSSCAHYIPPLMQTHHELYTHLSGFIICIEWLLCTLAGSLFPDIDIKSKGQKLFYRGIVFALLFLFFYGKPQTGLVVGLIALTPLLTNHRGLFHRLWFIILLSFASWWGLSVRFSHLQYALLYDLLFFCSGAISHLWLDMGFKRMVRLHF